MGKKWIFVGKKYLFMHNMHNTFHKTFPWFTYHATPLGPKSSPNTSYTDIPDPTPLELTTTGQLGGDM